MTTIFAIAICMYAVSGSTVADGCRFPENGMKYYQTAEECERIADLATRGSGFRPGPGGDAFRREVKCFSKLVNAWAPTQ